MKIFIKNETKHQVSFPLSGSWTGVSLHPGEEIALTVRNESQIRYYMTIARLEGLVIKREELPQESSLKKESAVVVEGVSNEGVGSSVGVELEKEGTVSGVDLESSSENSGTVKRGKKRA